jgi:aminomethyltransferase
MPERRSPFYSNIVAAGAAMGRVGGDFISAKYYTGVEDEHLNTRSQVGMQDLSTMGKMDIRGSGAEALVNHVIVNDAAAMRPGQVRYSTVCREDGGIMDDLTVFRLGEEHFMLVTGSVNRLKMRPWLMKHAEGPQRLRDGRHGRQSPFRLSRNLARANFCKRSWLRPISLA